MTKFANPAVPTQREKMARTINDLISTIASGSKKAEAYSEPGDHEGPTSHPVKDVEDGTRPATTGFRSQENSTQVKKEQGVLGVESVGAPPSQDSQQPNMGTHQALTGEDPSVETSSTKPGKEDGDHEGASTHPARTDNDALNGGKYAEFMRHRDASTQLGNQLLADIVVGSETAKTAAPVSVQHAAAAGAAAADAKIAAAMAPQEQADRAVMQEVSSVALYAQKMAIKAAAYLQDFYGQQQGNQPSFPQTNAGANAQPAAAMKVAGKGTKRAGEEEEKKEPSESSDGSGKSEGSSDSPPKSESSGGDGGSGGGGGSSAPPAAPPMDAGMPPASPADPSGGAPLPGAGDALSGMMGGDMGDGGGGMQHDPMAGGDPMGGGGGNPLAGLSPEDLQMLLSVLLQEQQGGGGGGMPPGGGGMPPGMPPDPMAGGMPPGGGGMPMDVGAKMAAALGIAPKTPAQQAKFAAIRGFVREITGRR